ncbi:MAG: hypothetical protein AAGA48_36870 [Myxococcota bacterium]
MPRSFRHQTCGTVTEMPTAVLATILRDPHLVGNRTLCKHCGTTVPMIECVWVETGEDLQSYIDGLRAGPIHEWKEERPERLDWPDETEELPKD